MQYWAVFMFERRFYFKTTTNFCYRWARYVLWVLQCCSYIVMLSKISLSIGVTSPQQLAVASITNVQGVSWKTGFCLLFKNTREFVTPCLPYNAHPHLLLPLSQLLNGLTITCTKQNCLKWRFGVFQQWCQILNAEFTRKQPTYSILKNPTLNSFATLPLQHLVLLSTITLPKYWIVLYTRDGQTVIYAENPTIFFSYCYWSR